MLAGGTFMLEFAGSTGLSVAAFEQPMSTVNAIDTRSDFCMRILYT